MNKARAIGSVLTEATGDQHKTFWLKQGLSLVVQRGNGAIILAAEE